MDLVELDSPQQRLPDTLLEGLTYFILNGYRLSSWTITIMTKPHINTDNKE